MEKIKNSNNSVFISMIEKFSKKEELEKKYGITYRIVTYTPKKSEIVNVKNKIKYLFMGNGNTNQCCLRTSHSSNSYDINEVGSFRRAQFKELSEMIELFNNDPEKVLSNAENSIMLIDEFLNDLGKDSILNYYTNSLYGEGGSFFIYKLMESGSDMKEFTLKEISNEDEKRLWVCSQLTTYKPYASLLFFKRDLSKCKDLTSLIENSFGELTNHGDLVFHKLKPPKITPEIPVKYLRRVHANIYAKMGSDIFEPAINDFRLEGNAHAFSLLKIKDKKLYFESEGLALPKLSNLHRIIDFVLITDKEFYENGIFKFLILNND